MNNWRILFIEQKSNIFSKKNFGIFILSTKAQAIGRIRPFFLSVVPLCWGVSTCDI